jgi:hypothetical protein
MMISCTLKVCVVIFIEANHIVDFAVYCIFFEKFEIGDHTFSCFLLVTLVSCLHNLILIIYSRTDLPVHFGSEARRTPDAKRE